MADLRISDLVTASQLKDDDYYEIAQSESGTRVSYKTTLLAIAVQIATMVDFTSDLNTTSKKITGAINELKQLISLIPQFSIEVVQELPTEDISDTTIYLVPAEDPEVGNYYEEYIHVNNTWELVGTTAVDLSTYYTKLEVDGLLADKLEADDFEANKTASANPITLETKQAGLAKSCVVEMNPIQDLHGYSNPWAGGAWKNKFNDTIGTHTINANTDVTLLIGSVDLVAGTTYTISCKQTPNTVTWVRNLLAVRKQGTTSIIYNSLGSADTIRPMTYTPSETATYNILVWGHTLSSDTTYSDFQVEVGSTATSYAPYSNICPISGITEASVTRTGKNQCYQVLNGLLSITGSSAIYYPNNDCRSLVFNCKAGTTYIASGITANRCIWGVFNSIPNSGDTAIVYQNLGNSLVAFTPTKDGVCILYVSNSPVDTSNAQVELGSTATTAYEPYTAETHTKEFGQTVYGGTLDLNSGVLTIDRGIVDLGTLTWLSEDSEVLGLARVNAVQIQPLDIKWSSVPLCSSYKGVLHKGYNVFEYGEIGLSNTEPAPQLRCRSEAFIGKTNEEIKAMMSGVQLCYELATPTTIQLSPEALTLLKGMNVISTDGDKVQVEFSDIPVGDYSALLDYIKSLEARIQNLES